MHRQASGDFWREGHLGISCFGVPEPATDLGDLGDLGNLGDQDYNGSARPCEIPKVYQ